ncbi:MAG: hypothetical protein ACTSRZ_00610 [Promethearchaeota archaeon]
MDEKLKKDLEKLKIKFSLEPESEVLNKNSSKNKYFGKSEIFSSYVNCKRHKSKLARFQCPICKQMYCEDCIKYISKKNDVRKKAICKSCYRNYMIKSIIFFGSLLICFILVLLKQLYNL